MKQYRAHFSMRLSLFQLLLLAVLAWCIWGDPLQHLANLFWPQALAPWEQIDLVYLPGQDDPHLRQIVPDLPDQQECRNQAQYRLQQQTAAGSDRGSWSCQVVHATLLGRERVVRLRFE